MTSTEMDPHWVEVLRGADPDPPVPTVESLRQELAELAAKLPRIDVGRVDDITISANGRDVRCRVYRPDESATTPAVALYFHGGGWVAGDLDTHDALCRQIVHYSDTTLVAVDYPLAPEHPFPAALEVALGAHAWLRANLATVDLDGDTPIAVVGDSAGANLAVALTLAILNSDNPGHAPAAVIATHPVLQPGDDTWSRRHYGRGFGLTTRRLEALWAHYVPAPEQRWQPAAAPLAADSWTGFPPTLVQTAELDPTRSDGDTLADRLREAGVKIRHTCYAGQIHGFQTAFDRVPGAAASLHEIGAALQVLGGSGQFWAS